ncbi:D-alanyl-D-alanine carboxypeptidase family protein [Ramlibacter sp.]|uniref:D-alanyl-D-alanine carboxypeptidase family protein n=1 Tax=Ramlibacter sp. TaxID=1917967 RepID=UPI002C817834|nr:serine hydrolase [Ramlibacter sp.]HWI82615.1 serine hydrolase [Ramlibacter sp.]
MRRPTQTRPRRRTFTLVALLAAALAAAGGWQVARLRADRQAQQPPAVQAPAAAASAPAPAEAGVSAALADLLPAITGESPTTEADPPQERDGVSWGHRAGLHNTKDDLHLRASAAYVVEPGSGKVLLGKNEDAVLPIASLTKLMSALVVTEAKLPMDEAITINEEDVDHERNSRSRLRVGTSLPRAEALRLALMSSENRAAHALGRTYPGGVAAFAAAMNRKARLLGMKNTTFVDPTGLSNRNQSTARDVALLVAAASREPLLREYSTTPQHEVLLGRRTLRFNNSNRLVKNPHWDINLQKTGYIVEAGQCLTMNAKVAGRDLILVLLDSADKHSRLADAERIKRFAGGEPQVAERPAAPAQHARPARGQHQAKASAQGEHQARARRQRATPEPRVHQTYLPRHAQRKSGDQR